MEKHDNNLDAERVSAEFDERRSIADHETHQRSAPPRWGRRFVIGAAIALVALPLIWASLRVEIARWYLASAQEAELNGDLDSAIAACDHALSWCSTRPEIWSFRGKIRLAAKDLQGALDDCNHAVELSPDGSVDAFHSRMLVYQRMGDHDKALADANSIVKIAMDLTRTRQARAMGQRAMSIHEALNVRAYARALANKEIDAGIDDINNAMARVEPEEVFSYLDTRGYLLYLRGDYEAARVDMERAVELGEQQRSELPAVAESEKTAERRVVDRQFRDALAVLYHHRGLVYQALGDEARAEADLKVADEMGYSPEDGVW